MILWFHHQVHGCSRHFCSVDWKFSVFPPLGLTCSIVGFQTQGLQSHEEYHAPSHCTCSLPRSTVSRQRYYVNMKMEEVGRETRGWFFSGPTLHMFIAVLDGQEVAGNPWCRKKNRSTSGLPLKGILDPNEAGMGQKNISGKKKIRKKAAVSA